MFTYKLFIYLITFSNTFIFYSSAFFHGQIEQPVRGLMSLINHKDVPIIVAINTEGVYILDCVENVSFVIIWIKFKLLYLNNIYLIIIVAVFITRLEVSRFFLGICKAISRKYRQLFAMYIFTIFGIGKWNKSFKNFTSFYKTSILLIFLCIWFIFFFLLTGNVLK